MNDETQGPTHNGDHTGPSPDEVVHTQSAARRIMDHPAQAAGIEPEPVAIVSPKIADPGVAELLNKLPGLVGAIDIAIKETAGKPLAFMLMVFTPGTAMHATNTDPKLAQAAATELVAAWAKDGRGEETPIAETAPRVVDAEGLPAPATAANEG